MNTIITTLAASERIYNIIDSSIFLNPAEEIIDNAEKAIFNSVINSYAEGDRDRKINKETQPIILIRQ
jgi:hypothetical protein